MWAHMMNDSRNTAPGASHRAPSRAYAPRGPAVPCARRSSANSVSADHGVRQSRSSCASSASVPVRAECGDAGGWSHHFLARSTRACFSERATAARLAAGRLAPSPPNI